MNMSLKVNYKTIVQIRYLHKVNSDKNLYFTILQCKLYLLKLQREEICHPKPWRLHPRPS